MSLYLHEICVMLYCFMDLEYAVINTRYTLVL